MRLLRLLLRLLKGCYDLLATYALAWILFFALVAWGFQLLLAGAVALADFESPESLWSWAGRVLPLNVTLLRVAGFGLLHLAVFWALRPRLKRAAARVERGVDRALARYRRWGAENPRGRTTVGGAFSVLVTALLVPFVIQPTLVPLQLSANLWVQRAANLADGSASAALVESVIGLYRRLYADPALTERGVTSAEYDASLGAITQQELDGYGDPDDPTAPPPAARRRRPLMDRWDPLLWRVVGGDRRAFAQVKAFMWVESGGTQFAVSHTGCAGLMQFCARTARSGGFRQIFGLGQVYPCRCQGRCGVSRSTRHVLESGDPELILGQRENFPCELSDARFDPRKSLAAGRLYIKRLAAVHGDNIHLMYIGYNSGPAVAERLWAALGRDASADLHRIAPLLPAALEPYYGAAARGRARALATVHLPKLQRAYQLYLRAGPPQPGPESGLADLVSLPPPPSPATILPIRDVQCSQTLPPPSCSSMSTTHWSPPAARGGAPSPAPWCHSSARKTGWPSRSAG